MVAPGGKNPVKPALRHFAGGRAFLLGLFGKWRLRNSGRIGFTALAFGALPGA